MGGFSQFFPCPNFFQTQSYYYYNNNNYYDNVPKIYIQKHSYYYNNICKDISEECVLKFTTRLYFIIYIFSMCVVVVDVIFVVLNGASIISNAMFICMHRTYKKKENFCIVCVYDISQKIRVCTTKRHAFPCYTIHYQSISERRVL